MEIKNFKVDDLIPYVNNPRDNTNAIDKVASSIKEFGFKVPIVIDKNNVVVTGHTRLLASKKLGIKEVPCVVASDLTDAQIKAFRIADNKVSEFSEWDEDLLKIELEGLQEMDFDIELTGFDDCLKEVFEEDDDTNGEEVEVKKGSLSDRFIVPPFSVLDTKSGQWQERKRMWKNLGIKSGDGRDVELMPTNFSKGYKGFESMTEATSIFDPVICEIVYRWFNIDNGSILDPFAGGSVRGIVADKLGYKYTGIDLREEQIQANEKNALELKVAPRWICDDSNNVDKYIEDGTQDLFFTCPPYADLEVYSEDERDISNKDYEEFLELYNNIISKSLKKIKDDRFAVIVVGDVRDKKGYYRDFISDTKRIFIENDFKLYNELILLQPLGTASIRATKQFNSFRKNVKVHENILVFYKGDIKKIKENYKKLEMIEYVEEE